MTGHRLGWPGTGTMSLLAALTTWLSLLTWTGFSERPSGFLVPLVVVCLLVAVVGMLLRALHLHAALVLLGQLLVLLVWVDHVWAGHWAVAGWLPTGGSLAEVGSALGQGISVSQHYAAPVPGGVDGLFPALVLAGAGAVVLVDLLACGLRRVPLAGLPLLAVYTAPLSILDEGVPWPKFALGALCFLVLMATEESRRLSHWGRQLSSSLVYDSDQTRVNAQAVRSAARKIGLTATGLAVVVPLLVPTLGAGLLAGNGHGPADGSGSVSLSNPMVSLKRNLVRGQNVNLVYVTTPNPDPSYLRIAVLDRFDGTAWLPGTRAIPVQQRTEGPLPPPPGLDPSVKRTTVPYSIRITPQFASRWLPTPYPTSWIRATGDWRYDTSTMDFISAAAGQSTAGLSYRLKALQPAYNVHRLENAPPPPVELLAKYTKLPKNLPASVSRLAHKVTAHQTSDFARAVRLQRWFQFDGGFSYSLRHASGDSMQQLAQFLGTGPGSRVGYCQQFAAAMALMGRALGIPSRVAVGFLQPQHVSGDTWVYSSHDLHAWPEMYFDGAGWLRFEPTPAPRVTTVPAYTLTPLTHVGPVPVPVPSSTAPQHSSFAHTHMKTAPTGGAPTVHPTARWRMPVATVLVVLAVLLVLLAPRLLRDLRRHRRWATATTGRGLAEAAWAELRDVAWDLRLGWDDAVTPRARARQLAALFGVPGEAAGQAGRPFHGPLAAPEAAAALDRLVERLERARFARPGRTGDAPSRQQVGEVADEVGACARALRDGVGRGRRVLARWLPVSLVRGLGGATRLAGVGGMGIDHAT